MSNLKSYSKNILTKLLLGLLVVSFVLFGISSFLLEGSNSWIAKVDGRKISIQKLQQIANYERHFLMQRNPDNDDLKNYLDSPQFQLDVLSKILNEELITTIADRYGIKPDRTSILREITKDKNFHRNNKFDHRYFKSILKANGLSEDDYIKSISNEYVNQMTTQTFSLISPIDGFHSSKVAALKEQVRYADQILISPKIFRNIKKPSSEDLKTIYNSKASQFEEKETRNIKILQVKKRDLIKNIRVSNKEARNFYNQNSEKFLTEEKRDFLHLHFNERDAADDFLRQIESSPKDKRITFYTLAQKLYKKTKKQVLVKEITKNDSLPEIATRLFKFRFVGDVSQVFQSDIGYHIIILDKITPPEPIKFSTLKKEIKKQLKEKKEAELLNEKSTQISEFLVTSNSLSETARKFKKVKIKYANNISRSNSKKDSKVVKALRSNSQLMSKIFSMDEGALSNLIESENDFIAVKIDKVKPARIRSLTEVKRQITKYYYEQSRQSKALSLAKKVSSEVFAKPRDIRKIAKKYGLRLKRFKKFNRVNKVKVDKRIIEKSSDFLDNLFDIKVGQATNFFFNQETQNYEIAVLKKIKAPNIDLDTKHTIFSNLSSSYRKEFIEVFNNYIEKENGVQINKKFIENLQRNSLNEQL